MELGLLLMQIANSVVSKAVKNERRTEARLMIDISSEGIERVASARLKGRTREAVRFCNTIKVIK